MNSRIEESPEGARRNCILDNDERWELARRVAASPGFSKSVRLRDFLLYVCEKTLTDRQDEVHEQQIGLEVFGRRDGYNPSEDNIVRVEARELRKRLDRYFASPAGRAEKLRIRVPKGSYVPKFEPNNNSGNAVSPIPGSESSGWIAKLRAKARVSKKLGDVSWTTVALGVAVVILLGARLTEWQSKEVAAERSPASISSSAARGIWPALFPSPRLVQIVVADSSLVLAQDIARQVSPLTDYYSRRYVNRLKGPEVPLIVSRPYTSLADVLVTSEILQSPIAQHRRIVVRYARHLQIRDLENNNLIFLGSSYSDPWIKEFDAERKFALGIDGASRRLYFINRSPQPGEAERYYSGGRAGNTDETYGLVSFLPNLLHSGNVLILEGTNSEGTEAAGDFITDPHYTSEIRRFLGLSASGKTLPYFQLLLKTTAMDGAPSKFEVVAHRTLAGL
ncbi:MAG TPA: hypothetical protein VFZ08_15040 [Terriglobia bacterium]|nr:hypothetical protein [Terriglobia bacterium]